MEGPSGNWSCVALDPEVRVEARRTVAGAGVEPAPALPADLASEIASIWTAEVARHPALFNGRVFSADGIAPGLITGHWTEYRRVLAQIRRPALFATLNIRPLAVNGLLECADGLVFGRRQADAVYLPGWWQAAPAGNVESRVDDGLDLTEQLLAELQEELGLRRDSIETITPVAAIEHAVTHVVDIGFLLRTPLCFSEIETLHRQIGNAEYDALRVVSPNALGRFIEENGPTMLPSAHILIDYWTRDRS